tara:strand:- start:1980 stop:2108 length:129 start_codon:yes stop_codon:yes gene_type:complete
MASRKKKLKGASMFKIMVGRNGRGKDEKLDSYRYIMRLINGK